VKRRPETVQTAVRLPVEMHERLRQGELGVSEEIRQRVERTFQQDAVALLVEAAAKNQRTIAAEIEHRLERTFAEDALDPITRELLTGIVNLAAGVQADLGAAWHSAQEVQEVFAAAVALRLAAYKPSPKGARALMQIAQDLGLGDLAARAISQMEQAPDALGAVIESADRRTHSYEHLRRLQAARQRASRVPRKKAKD
jgi:hypothetical protein